MHILNRCPHKSLRDVTHGEAFFGVKPSIDLFRVVELIIRNTVNQASWSRKWVEAMQEECVSITKNEAWDLVPPCEGKKVIGRRWIIKLKQKDDDSIKKHKTRFMEKVFIQNPNIDYDDNFSPVA